MEKDESMTELAYDVAIVGGGPAGATVGAALARQGARVVVCERVTFPRFHIGESLLPAGNQILREIGVWDRIEAAGFVRKPGAEFESGDGSRSVHNVFANGLLPGHDYTYQVERSRFDEILLDHARESGATVLQPVGVAGVDERPDGWDLALSDGRTLAARYLVDASGRETFLARRRKEPKAELPYPRKVAVYAHFRGLKRAEGERGGNIIITRWEDGWFWQIPLDGERTSVGLVSANERFRAFEGAAQAFFNSVVEATPALARRFERAEPCSDFHLTADYTYMFERFAGPRHLLVGDAASFIDPVFSSGVYLAMQSGLAAARLLGATLPRGGPIPERAQRRFTTSLVKRVAVMRGLIDTFYDRRGIEVFLSPSDRFRLFAAVNSVVAGNTRLPLRLWWRYQLFLRLVRFHQRTGRLVPPLAAGVLGDARN